MHEDEDFSWPVSDPKYTIPNPRNIDALFDSAGELQTSPRVRVTEVGVVIDVRKPGRLFSSHQVILELERIDPNILNRAGKQIPAGELRDNQQKYTTNKSLVSLLKMAMDKGSRIEAVMSEDDIHHISSINFLG